MRFIDELLLGLVALGTLSLIAFSVGYLYGHNVGFDLGRRIGQLDAKFHFTHNGKEEGNGSSNL